MCTPVPLKRTQYKKMDVFTDREDICGQSGSFMLRYNSFVKKNWSLIYIHGIAGIGKTTLIEKLMSELLEKENPNLVYYKMNKDRSGNLNREKEQFLIEFAYHILNRTPGLNMNRFLFAYGKMQNRNDPDRMTTVAEKLYQIKKSRSGGKDSRETVEVLLKASSWLSDPLYDAETYESYVGYKKRIWDILKTGEGWTSECAPGKALSELSALLESRNRLEEALQYYRELSKRYPAYREDVEISEEELKEKIGILERLVN